MHIAIDSHAAAPLCSSETTQVCLRNTLIRQTQSTIRFVSRTVQDTLRAYFTLHSMCVEKRSIQRAHGNIGFAFVLRTRHETPRARLKPMSENDMLVHMCV